MSLFHKAALLPSIVYGVALEYIGLRHWYTRIDQHCILGALPMKRNYKQIIEKENVNAVLTLNEDHELEYGINRDEWARLGIDYMQIPVRDYFGVASLEQIKSSIDFINKHKSLDQCVYVHCKAGRYRSALIVACYLVSTKKFTPSQAIEHLKLIRPHVILDNKRQSIALNSYYDDLIKNKKGGD